jgi:excisionase family DNA binding protein
MAKVSQGEVLLTVAEAAELLKVSKDWLYRHNFPFTRHVGGKRLFSRNGLEAAIRENDLIPRQTDANLAPRSRRAKTSLEPRRHRSDRFGFGRQDH